MAKSIKTPEDRLSKKPRVGDKKKVTLESGVTVVVPVILPEAVPAGIIRKTRGLEEGERAEAILWETLELFCNDEELAELDTLTMDELNEAIELANGGADSKK